MQAKTITMNENTEICGLPAKNGKMKVGQEFARCDLVGIKNKQLERATDKQENEGSPAHPSNSGECFHTPDNRVGKEVSAMGELPEQPAKRLVGIDTVKYQKYLDDPSLSEDQIEEIVSAIWSIIVNFVDLGFEVHPLQQAENEDACGKLPKGVDGKDGKDSNESKPVDSLNKAFERASDDT
ncbi:MAG: hypothetical protein AAGF53_08045 [Pseudomonadota bacterium]